MRGRAPLLVALLGTARAHVCVHDAYARSIPEPAVRAPPTDGARARRDAIADAAPIRIKAIYAASNGGADIATEAYMTSALKAWCRRPWPRPSRASRRC